MLQGQLDGAHAVGGLGDDAAVAAAVEQGDQAFAQDRVVVGDEDAYEFHRSSGSIVKGRRARNCRPSPGCESSSS